MRPWGQIAIAAFISSTFSAHVSMAVTNNAPHLIPSHGLSSFEVAASSPMEQAPIVSRKTYPAALIRQIQQGLANQGFFLGVIDGRYGPKTEQAIRTYQKSADLFIDGLPSRSLALDLVTGGKVSKLLKRLKKTRKASTDAARASLMSSPETRKLLQNAETLEKAPHDSKACMANPEPKCLLIEASTSAYEIDKPEMRDWALGEILASQARAGLADDAIATTRRIHDPRLIIVALREIAKAQANAGQNEAAMAAVDIIPDPAQQIEAYVQIAEIQANRGHLKDAAATATHLLQYLTKVTSPLTKISVHARIAAIMYKAGHDDLTVRHIEFAKDLAKVLISDKDRHNGKRYIAGAYAETGEPSRAMDILKGLKGSSDDTPVLIAAATRLAQVGEAEEALITAEAIEAVRYRALVLARIASYQAGAGDLESSRTTMDKALAAAKTIKFPFAKAYAYSRIALSLNEVSISAGNDDKLLKEALATAAKIKDERLKAQIFWTIADAQASATDTKGKNLAIAKAKLATADIKSPFSRVWMLCDIAKERAKRGHMDGAWDLFNDALEEAKSISNPWGRARALGKAANTMTFLADQTREIAPKN
ncbi:MAG: hypothetical protein COB46_11675 [Rhodospirillaceae bacterium]|nr:MAG: hypothetical protein COB46_11675 [Rhodospirillaceae bacterium]